MLSHPISPSRPLVIDGEEVMGAGYLVDWFLFKGEPYDIGRVHRPDGIWTGYYVDVLEPVKWTGADPHSLHRLVDLFLDIWISPDGSYQILDEDEFEEAEARGHITPVQAAAARATLASLLAQIDAGTFPPEVVRASQRPERHQ